jgi:hypothetical protein
VGLSHLISRFRYLLTAERLRVINQVTGALLFGFGALLIGEAALKWAAFF